MKIIFGGKSIEVMLTAQTIEEIPLKNVRPNCVPGVTTEITFGGGTESIKRKKLRKFQII